MFSKKEFAVVSDLGFISRTNFMLGWVKHEKSFITSRPDLGVASSNPSSATYLAWRLIMESFLLSFSSFCNSRRVYLLLAKACTQVLVNHYPYNFDPLKPHFYIVKLGFTEVYIHYFPYFCSEHRLWYSLEPPRRVLQSMFFHNLCFWAEIRKISVFLSEIFQFLEVKFSIYIWIGVFS